MTSGHVWTRDIHGIPITRRVVQGSDDCFMCGAHLTPGLVDYHIQRRMSAGPLYQVALCESCGDSYVTALESHGAES